MKNLLIILLLLLTSNLSAQVGNRYTWVDSTVVTTTSVDSTYDTIWEEVAIVADTVDVLLKFGGPDYTNWDDRTWFKLLQGMSISIGPSPRLKRLEMKTTSGVGTIYLVGSKKKRQH